MILPDQIRHLDAFIRKDNPGPLYEEEGRFLCVIQIYVNR